MSRTVDHVLSRVPSPQGFPPLSAPRYVGCKGKGVALAVEDMKRHMTDEGWQVMLGLEASGYTLAGHGLTLGDTCVPTIIGRTKPGVVVVQDKREWDTNPRDFREMKAKFDNVKHLRGRSDLFKLTILKDAHQSPPYHRGSADEMGVHAWIVYYHPRIVQHVSPYVRPEHLIRVYHTVDLEAVPEFDGRNRRGCLLSGAAVPGVYPLRNRLMKESTGLHNTDVLKHPGYHANGSATPGFLKTLSEYKVAICTSSIYGYALRKIIEATAAGCAVVTDLPEDEVLPFINHNLYRVESTATTAEIDSIVSHLIHSYDPSLQEEYARRCKEWYDYRAAGKRLTDDIETMRANYNG